MRDAIAALTEAWRRWGHDIGFGIGIAHGFATLGTIGFEGRFDYAAIGTVSNVASRLCDEAKPGQILISPRVLTPALQAVLMALEMVWHAHGDCFPDERLFVREKIDQRLFGVR
jgi:class 3 adenylate cyclase